MSDFSYTLLDGNNGLKKIGLLVLQSDETIEHDFQRLIPAQQARQFVSRVASRESVSNDTLAEMAQTIPAAAGLLPRHVGFDVVGYGCTSGTSVIGAGKVAELVGANCQTAAVTEPLSALVAACRHLQVKRLAFLSPYVEEVSVTLREALADHYIETPVFGSFNEAEETRVANIDQQSLIDAGIALGRCTDVDGLFMSCTNLKTLDVLAEIEGKISKPVLSSNSVLAWHMCRHAGISLQQAGMGALLAG